MLRNIFRKPFQRGNEGEGLTPFLKCNVEGKKSLQTKHAKNRKLSLSLKKAIFLTKGFPFYGFTLTNADF